MFFFSFCDASTTTLTESDSDPSEATTTTLAPPLCVCSRAKRNVVVEVVRPVELNEKRESLTCSVHAIGSLASASDASSVTMSVLALHATAGGVRTDAKSTIMGARLETAGTIGSGAAGEARQRITPQSIASLRPPPAPVPAVQSQICGVYEIYLFNCSKNDFLDFLFNIMSKNVKIEIFTDKFFPSLIEKKNV